MLRIGDRDVADAYSAVKMMIGRDNEQGARYWAPYLLAMPEVLHALRITRTPDDGATDGRDEPWRGESRPASVRPVEIMTGDIARRSSIGAKAGSTSATSPVEPDPLWLRGVGDAFHFEHTGKLLYVQINKWATRSIETLAHFAQRLHDEIAATEPEKVAIDLRLNRGGDGTLIVPVIRALIQSESIDRKGRLFAIIGPATFSAAQMFADALEKYTNVTFVGEPTGSKGNAYGDSRKIVLPNSGITVRASIYYWQDWHPMDKRDATDAADLCSADVRRLSR